MSTKHHREIARFAEEFRDASESARAEMMLNMQCQYWLRDEHVEALLEQHAGMYVALSDILSRVAKSRWAESAHPTEYKVRQRYLQSAQTALARARGEEVAS